MDIVAFRGAITNESNFIERLEKRNEITTQGILMNASIALFEAKSMDYRSRDVSDGITGIGKGEITLISKDSILKKHGTITSNAQPGFPNHALLSDINASDIFILFKNSGVKFSYDPDSITA
ncbi:hypothetical protein L1D16_22010 [Vibrio sp. Isolate31]|uniref:hypothetical protein n=1 Tax=unclassified Vibrio TaxID=2614977 RepID=UPI001EFD93A8|nr:MULTISPECIES: hypothetical protein [unclassified Vibrio]MCG9553908.1 hypothetical protein [Vibrio sp. Isolate32]MCG9603394.1 hypothetical protein [Vibrio sp. Isolate31]